MSFVIIDAYTDLPICVVHAPDRDRHYYSGPDKYIVDDMEIGKVGISLTCKKLEAVDSINTLTQEKIFSLYPQTKQANLQARYSELMSIIAGTYASETGMLPARALTESEMAGLLAIQSTWAWIKTIRDASNVMVSQVNEAINAVAVDILLDQYKTLLATL